MSQFIKIYFWLKLKDTFFSNPKIKKLRRIAGGDTFTIIYLKLMLLSLKNNGLIELDGLEPTVEEEIALILDEEIDNVRITLSYLRQAKLIEDVSAISIFLVDVPTLTGKETDSAERKRKQREREKIQNVTLSQVGHKCVMPELELEKEIDKKKVLTVLGSMKQNLKKPISNFNNFRDALKNAKKVFSLNEHLSANLPIGTKIFLNDDNLLQNFETCLPLEKEDAQLAWDYLYKNRNSILASI